MTTETMRAVFWEGKPFHVSVKDTPKPTIQDPGDAIVRLTTGAICGSDLHTYHGLLGSPTPPWPMGHEGIGIVTEVGGNVTTVKVGDYVIIPDEPDDGHLDLAPPPLIDDSIFGFGPAFGDLGGLQGA
jgi:threonine dehydrogenase-like Zn-dependent dehydrogenase